MCPGCSIAVDQHAEPPPLLQLVKEAEAAAAGGAVPAGPSLPEPDDDGPLYAARATLA